MSHWLGARCGRRAAGGQHRVGGRARGRGAAMVARRCAQPARPRKLATGPWPARAVHTMLLHPHRRACMPNSPRRPAPRPQLQSGLEVAQRRRATCPRRWSFSTIINESGQAHRHLRVGAARAARAARPCCPRRRRMELLAAAVDGLWVGWWCWRGGEPAWARPPVRAGGVHGRAASAEAGGRWGAHPLQGGG